MDQYNNNNDYSDENNQNQRPPNPYLRPNQGQSQPSSQPTNPTGEYVPSWPSPNAAEKASGESVQNPYVKTQASVGQTVNPYGSPYASSYKQPESPYTSADGLSYSYTNTYQAPAQAQEQQPRRVILGATVSQQAPWTRILLIIIAVVFVGQSLTGGGLLGERIDDLLSLGGYSKTGLLDGEWWRLVTPIFLHIGVLHILFNAMALNSIGMQVEQLMGSKHFLLIFFLTGIAGNVATMFSDTVLAAGASGSIFGLLGALIAFFYRNRDRLGPWGQANLRSLLFVAGINLVITFTIPFISQTAHIGGLVAGLFLGYFLSPWHVKKTIGPGTQATTYRLRDFALEWWPVPVLVTVELLAIFIAL